MFSQKTAAPARISMDNSITSEAEKHLQIIEKYKPYIRLDKQEPFKPVDIDTYIEHCALQIEDKEVEAAGTLTRADILNIANNQEAYFTAKGCRGELRLQPPTNPTHPLAKIIYGKKDWRNSAAIYAKLFEQEIEEADGTRLSVYAIHYLLTYGYDDPTSVLPFFKKNQTTGWHYGDIEHIVVYVLRQPHAQCKKIPGDIVKVYYAQHGSGEGECVRGENLETGFGTVVGNDTGQTHVVVNVARGTHASYPTQGTTCRIVGLFNDVVHSDEPLWVPRVVVDEPFFALKNLTYGGSNVTVERGYWNTEQGERYYTTSCLMRACLIAFTAARDSCYDWIKYGADKNGLFMSAEHTVMSSTHLPVQESYSLAKTVKEEKVAANDDNSHKTSLLN